MVLADTQYWLALANSRDRWHEATDQRDFNTYCWKDTEPFHNLLRTTDTGIG